MSSGTASPARIAIVGGGIGGLAVAEQLVHGHPGRFDIVVFEREATTGGKLKSTPFAGIASVDEGADAFLLRVPAALELADRVGLGDDLVNPAATSAAIWHGGRLHPIPPGLLLGVPAGLRGLARSGLLSPGAKLRAALEPLLPRRDHRDSLGLLIRGRFGDAVHELLVDSLVGSIYGSDTDVLSLEAVPQLGALAKGSRSLLVGARAQRRRTPPAGTPVFAAPRGGMAQLAAATAAAAAAGGVTIRTDHTVTTIEPDGAGWRVDDEHFDAVVVAAPAAAAAPLLRAAASELSSGMAAMTHAAVAMVTVVVDDWPSRLNGMSGYLVPKPDQKLVTAASFGSQKWTHWRGSDWSPRTQLLRISLGRDGLDTTGLSDDQLVSSAVGELWRHIGVSVTPRAALVSRWPAAFPQYRPGHAAWLAALDRHRPANLWLTGASYRGIGVPSVIADAQRTAELVAAALGAVPDVDNAEIEADVMPVGGATAGTTSTGDAAADVEAADVASLGDAAITVDATPEPADITENTARTELGEPDA